MQPQGRNLSLNLPLMAMNRKIIYTFAPNKNVTHDEHTGTL